MADTPYPRALSAFTGLDPGRTEPDVGALAAQIQDSDIVVALRDVTYDSGTEVCTIVFKAALDVENEGWLDTVVAAHDGEPLPGPNTDSDGNPIVTFPRAQDDKSPTIGIGPRLAGSELIRASHNFADRTTWWSEAGRSIDEALVDQGTGITWKSATAGRIWINIYAGKFLRDDALATTHNVVVKVDGVEQTMRGWFSDDWDPVTPEDYYVDFANGAVVFRVSQEGNSVVATYSYENGSSWFLQPSEGRVLYLEEAELNASSDVVINDAIRYDTEVYVPGVGWVEVASVRYRTLWQIIQECRGNHVVLPALGGTKRGIQHDVMQIPLIYVADKSLRSSDNVRLRVHLESNVEFGGEHGSITFYALSRVENDT